jgi:thermostable 8-oxoguanine DNA glycosylase
MTDLSELVEEYLKYYSETQGVLPEKLEEFGETYRNQGHLTREQLYEIAYESSTRSAYHVRKNPEDRCRKVTENVLELDDDFSRIALISSLKGFKAPTASCILAALEPERQAVVDTRVWASLERLGYLEGRKESFDADDYVTMIQHIRDIADQTGNRVVDVGYALFAHDDDVREGTLH